MNAKMRRWTVLSLLLALLCGTGCGSVAQTFDSAADYSDIQGHRNWYYLYGDLDYPDELQRMGFSEYMGRYNGDYEDIYSECYIWGRYWLPGKDGGGIMMGFCSPVKGTLRVETELCLVNTQSGAADGVTFLAASERTPDVYCNREGDGLAIPSRDAGKIFRDAFECRVERGEMILFTLIGNGNNLCDLTSVRIVITV